MGKLLLGTLLLASVMGGPIRAMAGVNVDVNIGLPLPFVFVAPPEMIVLPGTDVYVVPDADVDIFFSDGWWWRPSGGRWYRSRDYDSGWAYHRGVPSFYAGIPSGWRNDYRHHRWMGRQWDYQRIPHQQVQRNWRGWKENRHSGKQKTWGGQGFQRPMRSQQPSREVQPFQPRPQAREAKPEQSQQREGRHPQQQRGKHEKGKVHNQDGR